jgi:nucleoid DNA-binding protein
MSKFTRADLREILRSRAGLGSAQARALTAWIIEAMAAAIAAGKTMELRGLGTFETKSASPGRRITRGLWPRWKYPPVRLLFSGRAVS